MPRYLWVVGGLLWLTACPGNGGGGTEDAGTEDAGTEDAGTVDSGTVDSGTVDPEQRMKEVRACILQRLPPAQATEWRVSGYVLVDTYVKCLEAPQEATAADFRAVVREIAQQEADASSVRILAPPGGSP